MTSPIENIKHSIVMATYYKNTYTLTCEKINKYIRENEVAGMPINIDIINSLISDLNSANIKLFNAVTDTIVKSVLVYEEAVKIVNDAKVDLIMAKEYLEKSRKGIK